MEWRHGTLRSFVVGAETGAALVLLVGAGLLVSSFVRLVGVDPGFRADGVAAIQTAVPDTRYPTPESRNVVSRGILAGLRRIPDGRAAAASHLPLTSDWNVVLTVEGGDRSQLNVVSTAAVSQGYFEVMGIPLLSGRDFNDSDVAGAAGGGLIISQSLARALWPGGAPTWQAWRRSVLMMSIDRGTPSWASWATCMQEAWSVRRHRLCTNHCFGWMVGPRRPSQCGLRATQRRFSGICAKRYGPSTEISLLTRRI